MRGLGPPPLPDDNIVDVVLGLADESLEIVDDAVVAGVIVGAMLPPAPPPPPDTVAALAATPATRDVTKDAKLDVQLLLLLPPSAIAVVVFPPLPTALPMTAHANGCAPNMAPEEEGKTCSCNGCAKIVLLELLPLLSSDVLV